MTFWRTLYIYCLIVLIVFLFTMAWEFAMEPLVSFVGETESTEEKWKYIYTGLSISALALIFPFLLLQRKIIRERQTEKLYRQSEGRFRLAFENASVGVALISPEGQRFKVNKALADFLGYTVEELTNTTMESTAADLDALDESMRLRQQVLDGEITTYRNERSYRHKQGHVVWGDVSGSLLRNEDGEPEHFIVHTIDITERKKAEDELRNAQQTLSGILINLPGTIFRRVLNPDGGLSYEYSEGQLFADLGLERADGDDVMLILAGSILPEDEDARRHAIEESAKTLQPCEYQFRIRLPTGEVRWVESRSRPFLRSNGEIVWDGLSLDITEQKQAEETAIETQARMSGILHIAPQAVITIDEDMNIQLFNQGAERIFGYGAVEVMGRSLDILMPEYFRDGHQKHVEEFDSSGDTYRLMDQRQEIFGLRKDGTEFPASASVSKLEVGGEKIYTVMMHDITERKHTHDALIDAKREAETANRAKSEFLAAMSHELRTPLNAILGFADIMSHQYFGPINDKYKEYAEDIEASGEHLLALVNEILDLSTIEAGKQSLVKEKLSTMEIISECERIIEDKARSHGIDLVTEVSENLPPLYADRRASKQILLNLLSNAVKFTPQGGKITVSAKASKRNTTLKIADTGKGIPAEKLPKLTDPFTRVDGDPYLAERGWGLGLAITKSLIDLHDGTLDIKSRIGKGTTVTVTFPNGAP